MNKSTKHCRICLEQNKKFFSILKRGKKNISHLTKLIKIIPQMTDVKEASRFICEECCNELNIAYNFFEKCMNNLNLPHLPKDSVEINAVEVNNANIVTKQISVPETKICEDVQIKLEVDTFDTVTEFGDHSRTLSDFDPTPPIVLNEDKSSNTNHEILTCVMCNAEFTNKENLQQHVKVTHAVRKLLEYDSYGTIRRAAEKQTHKFISEVNTRNSKRTSLLENSQIIMSNIIKEANVASKENDKLSKENDTIVPNPVKKSKKKYECLYCAKILDNKVQLTKHLQLHEISDMQELKSFKCRECDVSFNELTRLALHVRGVHEKLETYQCLKCSVICASARSLRTHMHVHDSSKASPGYVPHMKGGYKCLTCGMRLSNHATVSQHLRTHSSARPFRCDTCPASFKTKDCLRQHLTTQHEPITHPCTACDRVFNYKYMLLQHLATHVRNKQEKC